MGRKVGQKKVQKIGYPLRMAPKQNCSLQSGKEHFKYKVMLWSSDRIHVFFSTFNPSQCDV